MNEEYIDTGCDTDLHYNSYKDEMDVEYNSNKMKIKDEQTSDNEGDCLVDTCDQIEELVNDYRGESKWKDHTALGNFEFVKLEDFKDADTDVSCPIETRSNPISIEEGMLIIVI